MYRYRLWDLLNGRSELAKFRNSKEIFTISDPDQFGALCCERAIEDIFKLDSFYGIL